MSTITEEMKKPLWISEYKDHEELEKSIRTMPETCAFNIFEDVLCLRELVAELEARNKALEDAIKSHRQNIIEYCGPGFVPITLQGDNVSLWALLDKGE